jgi:hypothetical protein
MSIEPDLVKTTDDAFRNFDDFTRSLRPTDEETDRFYQIVLALSDATKINYRTLREAFEVDEQTLMAWSCRNLLEIAIFTKFALYSKANADEFVADRLIDASQIGTSLKKLELYLNPKLKVSAFDVMIEKFATQMRDEGITRTKYRTARELAEQVGMLEEYETMNKVCSKFVHPTAWSLFTADLGSLRFPDARDVFYGCGAQYFAMVFAEIAPHVRKWGLRHKPDEVVLPNGN